MRSDFLLRRSNGPDIDRAKQSITIGVSSSRRLIATACKAASAKHATVRIYDTDTFRPFGQPLEGHTLTVTRIAFSPDDQLVLTVSRDRTWRLFHREESGEPLPSPVTKTLASRAPRICARHYGQVARSDHLGWRLGT